MVAHGLITRLKIFRDCFTTRRGKLYGSFLLCVCLGEEFTVSRYYTASYKEHLYITSMQGFSEF